MRYLVGALAFLVFIVTGEAAFAQKTFTREDLASDAVRLEETLRKESAGVAGGKSAEQLRRDGQALVSKGDSLGAIRPFAAAVAAAPKSGAAWLDYATAAMNADTQDASERYTLQERAATAAYAAYQHAAKRGDEAAALSLLGDIETQREIWRPALDAYRASLDRKSDPKVQTTYDDLREKHGFRILDYKVDNDSASPRACFQFSESLQRGKVDFAPFVAVSGNSSAAVTAEDQQLCVDGLKHGERYAIVLREGLPSAVGENLLKSADYEIYVKDRSPQVRFTGKNYVLPRVGQEGIPVVTVNTQKVDVEVYRIGDRNLLPTVRSEDFLAQLGGEKARQIATQDGVKIWTGSLDVGSELNRDVVTAFPVMDAVGKLEAGVYVMMARPSSSRPASADDDSDSDTTRATQWFVVSDLGLTAISGSDGVHAMVRSLATAEPLAGVDLKLVARNNEILATKQTDAAGLVTFDPGLARGEGGLAPGLLVATDAKGDYGFLDLGQTPFDLSDRGVKGREAPKGLDAFLYAERGVYRTGETVYLTALLRDPKGVAVAGLPMTIVVKRPDGVEYKRVLVEDQGLGGRSLVLPLLSGAARGTWRVEAFADPKSPSIGQTSFLVEDYVPERLDVRLKAKQAALRAGEPADISVDANYLYGAPGANLEVTGDVTVQASTTPLPGLEGYAIGLADESFENVTGEVAKVTTDPKGHAEATATIPDVTAPKPVEAKILLRVGEQGGRAVERSVTIPILPKGTSIAVKKDFGDNLSEGANANFDVVAVAPDGSRVAKKNVSWSLYRVEKSYQWFNTDGRWGYEPVTHTRRIADGKLDTSVDAPAHIAAAVGWGAHRLDVRSDDGEGGQTSVSFDVGWSGDATAQTPDLLETTLDRASYGAGDELKLRISSRFAGKATVAIVTDKVESVQSAELAKGETVVSIPVKAEWGAGAYAVVLDHRPLDAAAQRMPGRALGVAWFAIDEAAHKLDVSIDAPAKVRPRGPVKLPIRLAGLAPGEEANITVAAVDVGILNLTHYDTPKPADFFFGQRQLSAEIRDLYGLLIDGMQGARGQIRSGGDGGGALQGEVPTQEPLARYSGIVHVGPDGTAEVSFDLPSFNGTVRVMAVAWSKTRVGSTSADVIVRDPVVVAGTLPRFLSIGDQSRFFVEIDNVEGPAGDYQVDLDVHGPVVIAADALRSSVKLDQKGRTSLSIPVTAAGVGTATVDLKLSGQGTVATQSFALKVEPGTPELYRRTVRTVPPGGSVTVSDDLVADFVPGTGSVSLAVTALGGIDVPALLQALDRYPYGCSEQIVSRALPLLYVNRLASSEQLALDGSLDDRVKDSIARVMARQDSSGAFGLWTAGGDDDLWLDAYVTDFLTRAREHNFAVPDKAFGLALDHLRNQVVNVTDIEADRGQPIAYAAYVLARNGRPVMGDLRYLADTKLDAFGTPLARAQLAAALAMLGDRGRAERVFGSAVTTLQGAQDDKTSRPDYGSRLRDGAATLALMAETGVARDLLVKASDVVEDAQGKVSNTSTQEKTWMVMAAQALEKQTEGLALTIDGSPHKGALYRTWRGFALDGRKVVVANASDAPARIVVTSSGHPTVPEPAASHGYSIERAYYKLDGTKVDASTVKQNDRMVVVLKVTEPEALYARLLLVDLLPAGLEIDNPNLVDGGSVDAFSWLKKDIEPAHTEYRDDRFVAAFDRDSSQTATFSLAYVVRAVAPGKYVAPPAAVEDMYRPDRYGRTGFGTVEVTSAKP